MKIEILVMCYGYEKRFNWMLNSIQKCREVSEHDIKVHVTTYKPQLKQFPFDCIDLAAEFDFLKVSEFGMEKFRNRGIQRNFQVEHLEEDTEAVLFADCDHLYDPQFFDSLMKSALAVEKQKLEGETYMYTVQRTSTDDLKQLEEFIAQYHYPCQVPNGIGMYETLKTRVTSAPGAGNTQFVFRKDIKNNQYVDSCENGDRNFFRSITYRSDISFRRKFTQVVKLTLPCKQYHLQHKRYSFNNLAQQ